MAGASADPRGSSFLGGADQLSARGSRAQRPALTQVAPAKSRVCGCLITSSPPVNGFGEKSTSFFFERDERAKAGASSHSIDVRVPG